jgi:hypothetical protein
MAGSVLSPSLLTSRATGAVEHSWRRFHGRTPRPTSGPWSCATATLPTPRTGKCQASTRAFPCGRPPRRVDTTTCTKCRTPTRQLTTEPPGRQARLPSVLNASSGRRLGPRARKRRGGLCRIARRFTGGGCTVAPLTWLLWKYATQGARVAFVRPRRLLHRGLPRRRVPERPRRPAVAAVARHLLPAVRARQLHGERRHAHGVRRGRCRGRHHRRVSTGGGGRRRALWQRGTHGCHRRLSPGGSSHALISCSLLKTTKIQMYLHHLQRCFQNTR